MGIIPVYLIKRMDGEPNEYGDVTKNIIERKIYPTIKSVKQSEFYQAQSDGEKIECIVEIKKIEYDNEDKIRIEKDYFDVYRTYDLRDGTIELSLKKGVM